MDLRMEVENQQRTYCEETRKHVEKLRGINEGVPREYLVWNRFWEAIDTCDPTEHVIYLEHATNCKNARCSSYLCFSLKRILKHAKSCFHEDCRECQFLNPVLMEHVRVCRDSRKCNVYACVSITRAAFHFAEYSNGFNAILKEEPFSMEPEASGWEVPSDEEKKKAKKRLKQKMKKLRKKSKKELNGSKTSEESN